MNPSDLLFTNKFISGSPQQCNVPQPTLEHRNNVKKNREHEDLKDFLKNELQTTSSSEERERDCDVLYPPISNPQLLGNLYDPTWLAGKQNLSLSNAAMPIIKDSLPNLKKIRYRKKIVSYVNVDSRYRDAQKFPNPVDYNIYLNHEFKYLQSIRLVSVEFREAPKSINQSNNIFRWTTNYKGLEGITEDSKAIYEVQIPNSFYGLSVFVQTVEKVLNASRNDVPGHPIDGTYPNFTLRVDPFDYSIVFIERLESLHVKSIKTTAGSNEVTIRIINYGDNPPNFNCNIDDTGYPFRPSVEMVPIILTGLNMFTINIGGISVQHIQNTPFFPENVMNNAYKCPDISYESTGLTGPCDITGCFVYKLCIYDKCKRPVNANQTTCLQLETSKLNAIQAGQPLEVSVGRALTFEVDTKCGSFGKYLGLTTANQDVLINTNINFNTGSVENTLPWKVVGLGNLSLSTEDYILMRIETTSKPIGTISSNLICAKGGGVNSAIETLKKDNFYFAKIIFSDEVPGDVSIIYAGGNKFFYDAPLVSLNDICVQFYAANGELLKTKQDHSFTLEITQIQEILKDTLIDSRTGNIADVGVGVTTAVTI